MSSGTPSKMRVVCPKCSKTLMVSVSAVGKTGRCPGCSNTFQIPAPDTPDPLADAAPLEAPLTPLRSAGSGDPLDDLPPIGQQLPGSALTPNYGNYGYATPSAPKKERKKKPERESNEGGAFAFEAGIVNAGSMGGLLVMVIAAVWFVVGLMGDIIFFYPPVLFVIGFVAFVKGLAGGSSS